MTFSITTRCVVNAVIENLVALRGYKDKDGNAKVDWEQQGWILKTTMGSFKLERNPQLSPGTILDLTLTEIPNGHAGNLGPLDEAAKDS